MLRFWSALIPSLLAVAMFGAVVFLFILPTTERALLKEKRDTIKYTVQVVLSFMHTYAKQAQSGKLSLAEAQARAEQRILELRYGKEQKDYFWVLDKNARMLVHPYRPDFLGRDLREVTDIKGKKLFAEMVGQALTQGEAFVNYYWQWQDHPERVEEKLSYVKYFEPWGWVVGTGVYLGDVKAELNQLTKDLFYWGSLVVLCALLIALYIARRQYRTDQERIRAEKALRETSEEYQAVLQASPNPIVVYDIEDRVIYVNPAFSRYFGWRPEEVLGQRVDYVPPEFAEETHDVIVKLRSGQTRMASYETVRFKKDGDRLEVNFSAAGFSDSEGRPRGTVVCLTDISKLKMAEKALSESEAMFRTLAENSLDNIMRFDRQYRHLYINPSSERISGIPHWQYIGKTHRQLGFPPELCAQWEQAIQKVFDGKIPHRIELKVPLGYWMDWLLFPEFDKNGEVKAVLASARDISERKQAEKEKKRLEAHLQQAQKLEALGTLAGGIAHDFNNILGAISGYTELALLKSQPGSPAAGSLKKVLEACERAKSLIKQILTFSRASEEESKLVDVSHVAKEVAKLLQATLPPEVKIEAELQPHCAVMADPTHIHQMLMNLGANAGQAMQEGGGTLRLKIGHAVIDQSNARLYPGLQPGGYLQIQVSDTGTGIPPEVRDRIFDPFFTTKGAAQGTGLGLAVVHGIVAKYKGFISLYSEMGVGTTFNILLPCTSQEGQAQALEASKDTPRGDESVLLVDDEKDLLDIVGQWLETLGYECHAFDSPVEALAAFAGEPRKFDLVLSDLAMPQKNGLDFAKEILAVRPEIPIMLISGQFKADQQNKAHDLGVKKILMKPLFLHELAQAMREILDQAAGRAKRR